MRISRENRRPLTVAVDGTKPEQVTQFIYLESIIPEDGRCSKYVERRIATGKEALIARRDLLRDSLSLSSKKHFVKVLLLYGSETWTLERVK